MIQTMHNQESAPVSHQLCKPERDLFTPLLRDGEKIAFDLESRSLVLLVDDWKPSVIKLSPIEARLLLTLAYFYPHYAPEIFLAQAYSENDNLALYYKQLTRGEIYNTATQASSLPIADSIQRLTKKVRTFEMKISRIRDLGYVLTRRPGCTSGSTSN